jgi:hypothetical protein
VNWTVSNDGTGPTAATSWTDEVFLSPTSTFSSTTAVVLGEFAHTGALAAGDSYTQSQSVTLPVGISGSYFFIVQTDVNGQVFQNGARAGNLGVETDASNVNLTPPPDLTASAVTPGATSVLAGHTLNVTYMVQNAGAGASQMTAGANVPVTWTDSFYLSPTPTLNPGSEIPIGPWTESGPLAAGASYTNQVALTIPDGLSGTYYVIADADSGDVIFELDQSSKVAASTKTISVTSKPADLVVTSFSTPAQLQAGSIATLTWTVANEGTGDTVATAWNDEVFASAQPLLPDPARNIRARWSLERGPVVYDQPARTDPDLAERDELSVRHHQSREPRSDHQPIHLRRLREQLRQRQLDSGDSDRQPVAGGPRGHEGRGSLGARDRSELYDHLDNGERRHWHDER